MLLYDAKFLPITIAWAPFPKFFTLFRQNWNVRTSIIDSFSTIYLLSNVKVLSVSMSFPATVYKLISDSVAYGLYCLPSLHYFGRNHAYSVCNISSNCVNSDCWCTNRGSHTLSFTIFSKIFNIHFNQLAFYPCFCWFLPRVLQGWNWAWNFWLS